MRIYDTIEKLSKKMSKLKTGSRQYNIYQKRIQKHIDKHLRYQQNFNRVLSQSFVDTLRKLNTDTMLLLTKSIIKQFVRKK